MKTFFFIALTLVTLFSCSDKKPVASAAPKTIVAAPGDTTKARLDKPAAPDVKLDTLKPWSLSSLQAEDVQTHQKRYQEFQQRVQAESDAMLREYRTLMNTIIRSHGTAEYYNFIVNPEGTEITLIVSKK